MKEMIENALTKQIQKLIAERELTTALDNMRMMSSPSDENSVIQLQGRLRFADQQHMMGVMSLDDYLLERNRISFAALQLVGILDQHLQAPTSVPIQPQPPVSLETKVRKILFASATPTDLNRIQTDKEFRTINDEIKRGDHRHTLEFMQPLQATRIEDLIRAFAKRPEIIHFSGHGVSEGIYISDDNNNAVLLHDEAIHRLFENLGGHTELVLLNGCYTVGQAERISQFGIHMIGHKKAVKDDIAIKFAKGFYIGLSEGKSYEDAFNDGITIASMYDPDVENAIDVWYKGQRLAW
jgi:CHAT domain-containing protein